MDHYKIVLDKIVQLQSSKNNRLVKLGIQDDDRIYIQHAMFFKDRNEIYYKTVEINKVQLITNNYDKLKIIVQNDFEHLFNANYKIKDDLRPMIYRFIMKNRVILF
jgi:hypothetical protein